ncbi:hypothetical protein GCM10007049_04240 [Echinicola pacifica]|uniref:Peptidase inhibitor I9 n=1 Tax=Echinicola pacifica TaxID=346377 RepID=A0A918PMK0_9BACT|nr:S8 family serine peptidase [Echinicola pacifica]GGZ15311.1 hypothetical protein GCM10007049_04240 [Echinicola pacifica]
MGAKNYWRSYVLFFQLIGLLLCSISCTDDLGSAPELEEGEEVNFHSSEEDLSSYVIIMEEEHFSLREGNSFAARQEYAETRCRSVLADYDIDSSRIDYIFKNNFIGFAARLNEEEKALLLDCKEVQQIDEDYEISLPDNIIAMKDSPGIENLSPLARVLSGDLIPYGVKRVGGPVCYKGDKVAFVVDSGISLGHPDLNINEKLGFNAFSSGKEGASMEDYHGHGTHVAGVIAAKQDGKGVVGVAAGATVVPIKIFNASGKGTVSGFLAALEHIAEVACKGDVVNVSFTSPANLTVDEAVIKMAKNGIYFTIAAGNESRKASNVSPARASHKRIMTVSAMDENDVFADFSNYGNPPIDWCAPGVEILSTWKNKVYQYSSGTSMAAPHVAGLVLLGGPSKGGMVLNDPDGKCDPIAVHQCLD